MPERKRDLTRNRLNAVDDTRVVLVHDGSRGLAPVIKTAFVNGQELLLAVDRPISLSGGSEDLFMVDLSIIPTSIELISEAEMEARLIKE